MTYAYLDELNKGPSLLQKTSASLGAYAEIEKNSRRMGLDSTMTLAERVQLYEQLKDLQAKGQLPSKYNQTVATLERAFSQMEVSLPSATEKDGVAYLYDMNGNRVTMKQLLDNPDATYKWESEGSTLVGNTYIKSETKTSTGENPNGGLRVNHETTNTVASGVSHNSSGCIDQTQTFQASGRTILGDIQTDKGYSSLLSVDYSISLFR